MPRTVPPALQSIAALFEKCSESERRELLLHYASAAGRFAPRPDEAFDVSDLRHDPECADKVGLHLRMEDGGCHFRIAPGPEVQTLTKALAVILCEGLEGARPVEVMSLPDTFPEEIAGSALTRLRGRAVPYILHRMKEAVSGLLQRHAGTTKQ